MECYNELKCVKREYSLGHTLNLSLPKCFYGSFVNKTQNLWENSTPFWKLRLGKEPSVRPPSNGEGLCDIQHSMSIVLDTRLHLVKYLIYYDTLVQNAIDIITKCNNYLITKCGRSLLLYNTTVLLQNATAITKSDDFITKGNGYYKLQQYTLPITNCDTFSLRDHIGLFGFRMFLKDLESLIAR